MSPARVDAHQHFWELARGDYAWLTPELEPLYRDFGPADLEPLLRQADIEGTVLVQAAPTLAETRYLLEIAARTPWVAGVVGWVDLAARDVGEQLEGFSDALALRGIRPMLQDLPDPDWILRPEVTRGLREVEARGLRFDALIRPEHLSRLPWLVERHPELRIVIDHAAKPEIEKGGFEPWARELARVARGTGICCKLSGLVTEAGAGWSVEALRRYVDLLLESFGPERLLWGSDWPVVETARGFREWRRATEILLEPLAAHERAAILGGSAVEFYALEITEELGE
ncbi:MAG: amidohydrolase family protein [Myxococcales bacterium]|nr:amidohydrolase family protein [Myxococcales bacterium]